MPADRDENSGRFTEQYPDTAFLDAILTLETPTTSNIAEEVGCSYDLAYRRLTTLEDSSRIRKETIGSSFLWRPN